MSYVKINGSYRRRSRRSRGLRRRFAALALLATVFAFAVWGVVRMHAAVARPATHGFADAARPPTHAIADVAAASQPLLPAPAWNASQIDGLHRSLNDALAPALAGATRWSLIVVGADGSTLYDGRAERAVAPASAVKLVVAATALNVLGADYRFDTVLSSQGPVAGDGTLDGNLWLAGSGDPSFSDDDLRGGVGELARAGLRRVSGSVAVDPSAMRGPEINPHWGADDIGQDYAPPTNALSIDGDTVESRATVDGVEERFWTPVRDVPRYAATLLQRALAQHGIATGGRPLVGSSPLDTVVLWEHRSQPLRALEKHMLYVSDNHYAEQLLRSVGGESEGNADDAGGLSAERRFLNERGIPYPGLHLEDGSGLSSQDRIAAVTLGRILSDAQLRGGDSALYSLLPQGGKQGTLRDYDFTTALGRVRAKSGHIGGVSSLAGYVNTLHHGRVAFAFLVNGSPGDPDEAIVRAVDRLVEF